MIDNFAEKPESDLAGYAFLWDLDGTLLDSYPVILDSIGETLSAFGIPTDREATEEEIIRTSVKQMFERLAPSLGTTEERLTAECNLKNAVREAEMPEIPGAKETLSALKNRGARHFLYTHKGTATHRILDRLGIAGLFTEVVTSENGFPRKPAPDGILYLLKKYDLSAGKTYYVGDRSLDMQAASAAGIRGIFFRASRFAEYEGDALTVTSLSEIGQRLPEEQL